MLIRVVDLETTGLEPPEAAVCEIGYVDIWPNRGITAPLSAFINPGHPIPPQASAVHHIVDQDVANAMSWIDGVRGLMMPGDPLVGVLASHNCKFERQFLTDALTGGLPWICTYKCALRLWPEAPAHNNGTLRYWLRPAGLDSVIAMPPHRAGPDAYVTAFILRDMLNYAQIDDLIRWSSEPALLRTCHFGKHRGTLWREVPTDYLSWVIKQAMDEDVLFTAQNELERRRSQY